MADRPLIAGQYRLVEEIGRGGFGMVWHAHDERLHRDVAVKQLFLPHYLDAEQRRERHARSFREARSAARIRHPNAVTVHDVVMHDGCPWIVMEYVQGRSLDSIVKSEGRLPPMRAAQVGLAVAEALRAAHAAGVIHRDVKPANVLIGDDRIVLTDFGIAQIEGDASLTETGLVMGAPAYTSPERARGDGAIPASDVWSLGATLYFAVEGRRPFPGANANAVFHAVITREPAALRHAGPLAPVIKSLLRKEASKRPTAEEIAQRLATLLGLPALPPVTSLDHEPSDSGARLRPPRRRARLRRRTQAEEAPDGQLHQRLRLLRMKAQPALAVPGGILDPPLPLPRIRARPGRRTVAAAAVLTLVVLASIATWMRLSPKAGSTPPVRSHAMRAPAAPAGSVGGTLNGNGPMARALAFSPDGRTLAVGSDDDDVRLWDVGTRKLTATLTGHRYAVFAAAFDSRGALLATGGYDGEVLLWNTRTKSRVATLDPHDNAVSSLSFTPDDQGLVIATGAATQLWSLTTDKPAKSLSAGGGEGLFTAAVSPSGTIAVAGTLSLRVYSQGRSMTLGSIGSTFTAMSFSPDGRTLACAGTDGALHLWDMASRRPTKVLAGEGHSMTSVAFAPSGALLAGADGDTVTLWNPTTQVRLGTLTQPTGLVEALAFSPDGKLLATAGTGGTVTLWTVGR